MPIFVPEISGNEKSTAPASSRLVSLDVFRGATIAAMILVNDPGDGQTVYGPLQHASWNGWTLADLIFPFFLFIVGVSMAFSLASRQKRGESKATQRAHGLWRGFLLLAIGLTLNGMAVHFDPGKWRIYGVLQRIALCYVISSILALRFGRKAWIAAVIACLVGYWILMRYFPVPGFGVPTHDIPLLDPDRNIVAWLDRKLLAGHLYEGTRDPEGLLSTIPAIATTLLGLLTGDWLRSARAARVKAGAMAGFAVVCVALGEFFSIWFPINKKLWTSSYVLLTAGLAVLCLTLCYAVLDIRKWRGGWTLPFTVFGMNAIAAYIFAEVFAIGFSALHTGDLTWQEFVYQNLFDPLASPMNASLLYAISFVLVCWVAMLLLYRKRVFLKI